MTASPERDSSKAESPTAGDGEPKVGDDANVGSKSNPGETHAAAEPEPDSSDTAARGEDESSSSDATEAHSSTDGDEGEGEGEGGDENEDEDDGGSDPILDALAAEKPAPEVIEERLEEVSENVTETIGFPLDEAAVAATLESLGTRDVDAIMDFGKRHIPDLAVDVHARVRKRVDHKLDEPLPDPTESNEGFVRLVLRFIYRYAHGTLFAMPMAGQIAAVLVLRYSLWAWLDFSNLSATLVALGTIMSFLVSGGLIQAMGREGTFYGGAANWKLFTEVCTRLTLMGVGAAVVLVTLSALFISVVPVIKWHHFGVSATYFLLLTTLWLLLAVLYVLQDNMSILMVTLIGTGGVHLVMTFTDWGIYVSHWFGLVIAIFCSLGWAYFRTRRHKKTMDKKYLASVLPRPAVLLFTIRPFLAYGVMYFTFLFVDRLVGWSAARHHLPTVIWFRTPYELGMDWALLSLVLTIAVLEYTIHEFSARIIPRQQATPASKYKRHNEIFQNFYRRQLVLLFFTAVISIILTYFGIKSLQAFEDVREIRDFFRSPITTFTFWWAVLGYNILALGLLNGLFFFCLAKPNVVNECIAPALIVNVVVGFLASRMIAYEWSVMGLTVGSIVFAYKTSQKARDLFANMDYYYYSAY